MPHTLVQEPLLEREYDLGRIRTALAEARAGNGGVLLVRGEAGIGKTSLLEAARAEARANGQVVLSARGAEFERGFAFGVVRQFFEPVIARLDPAVRNELVAGAVQPAAPLVAGAPPSPGGIPAEVLFSTLNALYWLVVRLSERTALVLALDDAHWADAESLRFLSYLAGRIEDLSVLAIVASRSAEPGAGIELVDAIGAEHSAELLAPSALSEGATAELLYRRLGREADSSFVAACRHATGGNPFLVSELLTTIDDESIEPTADNADRVGQLSPAAVGQAVLARLARLPPESTALAQALAVLGPGARLAEAAALAGLDDRFEDAAVVLEHSEIIAPTRPLEFRHPLIGSAVYADMGEERRSQDHGRAAELLRDAGAPAEQIAAHLLITDAGHPPWAHDVLREAGRAALERGAPANAARLLRLALEAQPAGQQRPDVLEQLGLAMTTAGDPEGAGYLEQAVALMDEPNRQLAAYMTLYRTFVTHGQRVEASRIVEAIRRRGLDALLPPLLVDAIVTLDGLLDLRTVGDARAKLAGLYAREDLDETPGGRLVLADGAFGECWRLAPREQVIAQLDRVLRHELTDEPADIFAFMEAAMLVGRLGEADRAEPILSKALARFHGLGYVVGASHVHLSRAVVRLSASDVDGALADARRAFEGIEYGWRNLVPAYVACLAEALIEKGDMTAAARVLDPLELPGGEERWRTHTYYPAVQQARGRHALLVGDATAARALFADAGERLEAAGVHTEPYELTPWGSGLALACARLGDIENARRAVAHELDVTRSFGVPRSIGRSLRVSGLIEGGDRGVALLREAVETLAPSQAQLEHAYALTDLGSALRRAGKRREAREQLDRGLALARRCGATPLAERAYAELRAAGVRPRKIVTGGAGALTPSEWRVCRMAADGMTNKEIAQALFVTPRTVETHLTHAYQKLDISSREAIAAALTDQH